MPRDLVCIKNEIEEAVARIPGVPADPIDSYNRYEETAAAIIDALAYHEFGTEEEVEMLILYCTKLCELRAIELNVVSDFEG